MATSWNRYRKLIQHHGFSVNSSTVRQFRSAGEGINFNAGGEASERRRPSNRNREEDNRRFPSPDKGLRGLRRSDRSPQNNRSNFRQETMRNDISDERNFNNRGDKAPRRSTSHINGKGGEDGSFSTSNESNLRRERMMNDKSGDSFLDKFMLSFDKNSDKLNTVSKAPSEEGRTINITKGKMAEDKFPAPPEDADQIFKKMKETGLIPNAVAMLDGLCKDGLVQQAMDLFRIMREKGSIPEVVVYTAVVEGFLKAHKVDDAKRIFMKMQSLGIVPNAFSYTVMVQGMYSCGRVEDAVEYCEEMVGAGHSPNVATFVGLVNGICSKNEGGVEEAKDAVKRLVQKGMVMDEKAVRKFLDNKAAFSPQLWEAILGKKPLSSAVGRN